jgi:hypothetical protein
MHRKTPGSIPAKKSFPIEVPLIKPYKTKAIPGGIIAAIIAEQAVIEAENPGP